MCLPLDKPGRGLAAEAGFYQIIRLRTHWRKYLVPSLFYGKYVIFIREIVIGIMLILADAIRSYYRYYTLQILDKNIDPTYLTYSRTELGEENQSHTYEVLLLSNTNIQNFIMYKISPLQQHLQTKHTIKLIKLSINWILLLLETFDFKIFLIMVNYLFVPAEEHWLQLWKKQKFCTNGVKEESQKWSHLTSLIINFVKSNNMPPILIFWYSARAPSWGWH